MAKKNYYAVRQGRIPGIYLTWDEAKAQVHGFAGAAYKGFATKEEAQDYMAQSSSAEGSYAEGSQSGAAGSSAAKTQSGTVGSSAANAQAGDAVPFGDLIPERVGDRGVYGTGDWTQSWSGDRGTNATGGWIQNKGSDGGASKDGSWTQKWPSGRGVENTAVYGSGARASFSAGAGVSREEALSHLRKVGIAGDVSRQVTLLSHVFEDLCEKSVAADILNEREAYIRLCARYGMQAGDGAVFKAHPDADAVAFVDGGGDKSGADFASSRLPFGVVLFEKDSVFPRLYRYVFTKGGEGLFDWIFHASNVSAEVIADLFVMYICEKKGLRSAVIYQDNNLPAKYFSGEFKKIHNPEDYVLQAYITESIRHLSEGREIRFVYVPSEHSAKSKAKKEESYTAQQTERMPFAEAEFYNALSDILADYRWEGV